MFHIPLHHCLSITVPLFHLRLSGSGSTTSSPSSSSLSVPPSPSLHVHSEFVPVPAISPPSSICSSVFPGPYPASQSAPPYAGAGFVQVLFFLPPPHDLVHFVHSLHSPLMGHFSVLHSSVFPGPYPASQSAPSYAGAGFMQVLFFNPPPHFLLHSLHSLHSPSTLVE